MSAGRGLCALVVIASAVCLGATASAAGSTCFSDRIRATSPTGDPAFAFLVQTDQEDKFFLSREDRRFKEAGWQVGDAIRFCLLSRSWGSYRATNLRNGTELDLTLGEDAAH